MPAAVCLSLSECRTLPVSRVGTLARQLSDWSSNSALHHPVVKWAHSIVIPQTVWAEALHHSHLVEALEHWAAAALHQGVDNPVVIAELKQLLRQLRLPPATHQALLQCYEREFHGQPIWVRSSATQSLSQQTSRYVAGDSNVIEAIIKTWEAHCLYAATSQHLPHHLRWEEWGGGIVLTEYPDTDVSGELTTIQPFTHSKVITVRAQLGSFTPELQLLGNDEFRVDPRTMTIIHRHVATKPRALHWKNNEIEAVSVKNSAQTAPSLNDQQLLELADFGWKAKQHSFSHLQLRWGVAGNKLLVFDAKPLTPGEHVAPVLSQVLVHGRGLQSGYVQRRCWVAGKSPTHRPFAAGEILVVPACTTAHLRLLRDASGVISEAPITEPHILRQLREYHLPCIDKAKRATSLLHDHQEIVLHATQGQVLAIQATTAHQPSVSATTATAIMINQNPNPGQATQPQFSVAEHRLVPGVKSVAHFGDTLSTLKTTNSWSSNTAVAQYAWPELCTPLALLELPAMLQLPIAGVIINTAQIGAQLAGVPIETIDFHSQYWQNTMEHVLNLLAQALTTQGDRVHPPVYVTIYTPQHALIRAVLKAKVQGFVATAEVAAAIKPVIMEIEHELLTTR